jgi:hypothetical protein
MSERLGSNANAETTTCVKGLRECGGLWRNEKRDLERFMATR